MRLQWRRQKEICNIEIALLLLSESALLGIAFYLLELVE